MYRVILIIKEPAFQFFTILPLDLPERLSKVKYWPGKNYTSYVWYIFWLKDVPTDPAAPVAPALRDGIPPIISASHGRVLRYSWFFPNLVCMTLECETNPSNHAASLVSDIWKYINTTQHSFEISSFTAEYGFIVQACKCERCLRWMWTKTECCVFLAAEDKKIYLFYVCLLISLFCFVSCCFICQLSA